MFDVTFLIPFFTNSTIIRVHHCLRWKDGKKKDPGEITPTLRRRSPLFSLCTPPLSLQLELSTCSTHPRSIRPFFSFETQTRTVHQRGWKLFHGRSTTVPWNDREAMSRPIISTRSQRNGPLNFQGEGPRNESQPSRLSNGGQSRST